MGSQISRLKVLVGISYYLNKHLDDVNKRLEQSPGIPVPNPSLAFWTVPKAEILGDGELPETVDIVIIGSGITGTSFAYNLFKNEQSLKVLMLEARDVCSGATGRNGGHLNPHLYHDYTELVEEYGEEMAKRLIQFRLAHYEEVYSAAVSEDILEYCQCRKTETFDVHTTSQGFEEAKQGLDAWKAAMPAEASSWKVSEGNDASSKFGLASSIAGCIHGDGGAVHPYRFVTGLLSKLLERHPNNFFLSCNNPCTSIDPSSPFSRLYTVHTPKGSVTTPHIIHATNGWVSHLVTPLRKKILPLRGTMSTQRPGTTLNAKSTHVGNRAFVFYTENGGYDYLTQLPSGENELMFGGGWASNIAAAVADVGEVDDTRFSWPVASHLAGSLPLYFGAENWGKEKVPEETEDEQKSGVKWDEGRTKASWSGILGISADGRPWIGRLSPKLSGRAQPPLASTPKLSNNPSADEGSDPSHSSSATLKTDKLVKLTSPPGEWIAAGYTGEGMVHAWMSGKALASMVLNDEEGIKDWFPEILRINEKQWKKANIVDFISKKL